MSLAEIRSNVEAMTPDERLYAAACIQFLANDNDPAYRAMLAERMKRMDRGAKVPWNKVLKVHRALEKEGI